MIQIYLPYLVLIIATAIGLSGFAGYMLCAAFVKGEKADIVGYEMLIDKGIAEIEKLRAELNLEIMHGKQLEEALETMIQNEAGRVHKTFTEIHKDHNKILVDPESNEKKIPERKIFKRRKLGAK